MTINTQDDCAAIANCVLIDEDEQQWYEFTNIKNNLLSYICGNIDDDVENVEVPQEAVDELQQDRSISDVEEGDSRDHSQIEQHVTTDNDDEPSPIDLELDQQHQSTGQSFDEQVADSEINSSMQDQWGSKCCALVSSCLHKSAICMLFCSVYMIGVSIMAVPLFCTALFIIYLSGPLLIYVSTYLAADGKKLLQKYKQNGIQIIGKVEKRWKSHNGDDTTYEHAIVSYDSPDDGNKYHMELTDVRGSINPIIVLPGYPASGYPMGGIHEALTRLSKGIEDALIWSIPTRRCCFIIGCCICVGVVWLTTGIVAGESSASVKKAWILGGISLMWLFVILCCQHKLRGHPMLKYSQKVEGENVLTFKGNYCNRGLLMLIPRKF